MKKSFLFVFAAAGLLIFTSCERKFTCECVQTGKSNHTELLDITVKTKKKAKSICKNYEDGTYKGSPFNMWDTRSCKLK